MSNSKSWIYQLYRHPAFFWAVLFVAMWLPGDLGWAEMAGTEIRLQHAVATLALLGMLVALFATLRPWRPVEWLFAVTILGLFFVRTLFYGLVFFSGRGFSSDFFIHLGVDAAVVAWEQYQWLFVLLFIGLSVLLLIIIASVRRLKHPDTGTAAVVALLSIIALFPAHGALPEWRLVAAALDWVRPHDFQIADERLALWKHSPLIRLAPPSKDQLVAKPATTPQNLILLYIESGGLTLARSQRYPDLMPHMRRLLDQNALVDHLHASSYITIEGIVNSMCGTLFPFERASEWMAGADNLADNLPCLGDVLHAAGYQQSFIGGADKSFAGKGAFLVAHGYDKEMGIRDWKERGLAPPEGMWGLSDADLFDQSFVELASLKASGKPYNLTLLTIGTHLPGFFYQECKAYRDGKENFLNSVHCTDQLVGRWIDRLTTEGWLDSNTTLVITGDHQMFPNAEMKRIFGDAAVSDRRLPLVVLGPGSDAAKMNHGAGYDIAPTVLDLLRVESNIEFPLGRSLLRDDPNHHYFVSRYSDVFDESTINFGNAEDCQRSPDSGIPGTKLMSDCEREELSTLLRAQAAQFSRPPATLTCDSVQRLEIAVPTVPEESLTFIVSGVDQASRFTLNNRPMKADAPGLYQILFDRTGRLLQRKYMNVTDAAATPTVWGDDTVDALLAIVWRPGSDDARPPVWLGIEGARSTAGAALYSLKGGSPPQVIIREFSGAQLSLGRKDCDDLLRQSN